MTEIKVFELEMEDAYKLDTLFSACAKAAFREAKMQPKINKESQKKNGRVTAYNSESKEFPINEHGLDVLYSCYTSSKFVYPDTQHKKDVKYRLGYELSRVAPANYSPNFELLFPIMVYAILINNEYNYETVRRRVREDKAKGKHDEKCVWKYVDPFSIRHRKTATTCKEFSKRVTQLENPILLLLYYERRKNMSTNQIMSKIEALLDWEKLMEEAKAEADTLRDEIKQEMINRNTEELTVGQYIIRWTSVLTQRFDSTAFKKVMPDIYKAYTKQVASRRFTIA